MLIYRMLPPPPQPLGYTVYTRPGCRFCDLVKELLQGEQTFILDASPYLADRDAFLAFIDAQGAACHRTFPMVFFDGKFIGGFTETYEKMKEVS